MKGLASKGLITISGDKSEVDSMSKWLVDNRGYDLIDGSDDPDEYYNILSHYETVAEAQSTYRICKNLGVQYN